MTGLSGLGLRFDGLRITLEGYCGHLGETIYETLLLLIEHLAQNLRDRDSLI